MTLHANNFGDLPLHINYIREIANGVAFPPVNPEYTLREALRYPFGPDLYNALWEILGVPMASHLFVVTGFLVDDCRERHGFEMVRQLVGDRRFLPQRWTLQAGLFSQAIQYSGDLLNRRRLEKSLFLSVFITQRGVLFALPSWSVLLMESTRDEFSSAKFALRKQSLTTLGLHVGNSSALSCARLRYRESHHGFQRR